MSFTHNQGNTRSNVSKPHHLEIEKVPRQFSDYMNEQNSRFCEICKLYLDGLSIDDVKYLRAEDLINLVPRDHYKHKLLMTIMVRRYLYRPSETNHCNNSSVNNCSSDKYIEYSCDECNHICNNLICNHICSDYQSK